MRTLWLSLVGTVMLVLLGGLGSAVVGQDDEGVSSETLFEITIPADALPEALEKVNIETLTVAAGVDVSIGVENESLRGKALYVDSGELVLEPMVDALLWPQDAALGSAPVIAPAAEEVRLLPGDLVFLPAIPFDELREDAVIRIANPGSEPARMIGFHTHERGGQFPGFPAGIGFTYHSASPPDALELVSSGEAVFRLDRVVAEPGASVSLPVEALLTFYRIEAGEVERVMRGQGGEMSTVLIEGTSGYAEANPNLEYELTVVGQGPARLLELAVLPLAVPE